MRNHVLCNKPLLKTYKTQIDYPRLQNKIHLIQLFNLVALLFLIPLSFKSYLLYDYRLSFPLFIAVFLTIANYYFLKKTKNSYLASHFLASVFLVLMCYLLYTGGVNGTGPLWIFALPLIFFFLLGLKQGFMYVFVFLILIVTILYAPFNLERNIYYNTDFKLRIIFSYLLITFLSALYEYNNTNSFKIMQKMRDELEDSSTKDYLTSLYNRRGFDKYILNNTNPKGIILMCDMDFFKQINDTHGHNAGDFVLQEVAKEIKCILRKEDMAVRWGGEEFFIFLPYTSIEDGALIAEKIRMNIETLSLNYHGQPIATTLSIGIGEISETIGLAEAISNADNAMYQAKRAGRNSTVIFTAI